MTTTITPPVQPPPVQPPPEHKSWLPQFPRGISRGVVGAIVVAVLLVAGIAATLMLTVFSSQSAASILAGNGYQVMKTEQGSTLSASARPYVDSVALGSKGTSVEAVVILSSQGKSYEGIVQAGASMAGLTATTNGNVMTLSGPMSAWFRSGNGF